MTEEDLYGILGVDKHVDGPALKKAFRVLAKKCHPDLHNDAPEATERFKLISHAYHVLSDARRRSLYDRFGHESLRDGFDPQLWQNRKARPARPRTASESSFYARSQKRSSSSQRSKRHTPSGKPVVSQDLKDIVEKPARDNPIDIEINVSLTWLQAIKGMTCEVKYKRYTACPRCDERSDGERAAPCPECGGRGKTRSGRASSIFVKSCPACRGTGKIPEATCSECSGSKRRLRGEKLKIKIPPGAEDGKVIRLQGKGHESPRNAAGDLLLKLKVLRDERFEQRGQDLHLTIPISIAEAVLGTSILVPTPYGPIRTTVPPGTSSGNKLRLRGRGIKQQNQPQGDLYIKIRIEVPEKVDEESRRLIRQFAKRNPFRDRG